MSGKLKIFVATHNLKIEGNDIFVPILVGADIHTDLDLCPIKDNTGDNISKKNHYYCELTAHYWVWKNGRQIFPDMEYVGFCHYRRWFDFCQDKELIMETPEKYFENPNRIIAFNKCSCGGGEGAKSISLAYDMYHMYKDMDVDLAIMYKNNPEWYRFALKYLNSNNITFNAMNSFIMTWHNFDKLCSDLFPILEEHDRFFDIDSDNYMKHSAVLYSPYKIYGNGEHDILYQSRFNGFTAERLISSWIAQSLFDVREYPFVDRNPYS